MRFRPRAPVGAALVLAALFSLLAAPAQAWLSDGHMATGALAYDALERRDPPAVAAVIRLMASHPDRARFDRALGDLAGPARDRRTFELMARWADDVRRTPYDHDDWHYSQKVVSPMRWVLPPAFGGAERAFRRELAVARDVRAKPGDRAVALCWVFHIVGDMHQPLHAALWMDRRFPITDRGGNAAWVRTAPEARPQKLHWYWDSAAGAAGLGRGSPAALEAELALAHPDDGAGTPPADPWRAFEGWVAESRELAATTVYRRGTVPLGTTPETAPVLPSGYAEAARPAAEARLALAGRRIGLLLVGLR